MRYSEEIKARAIKLRQDRKLSYAKIAAIVGASETAVREWCNPDVVVKARQANRKYRQSPGYKKYDRERHNENYRKNPKVYGRIKKQKSLPAVRQRIRELDRKAREAESHPPLTYVIGSPGIERVIIGTTTNWDRRKANGYGKSLVPLRLLGVTNIPERAVLKYFQRERIGRVEIFRLTPELQEFIDKDCRFGDDFYFNEEIAND